MLKIFVDADACPVKAEVYRVAKRHDLSVTLVAASRMRTPSDEKVELIVVDQGQDAADDWIAAHAEADDVVITGDIPLAARCLAKGAHVLGHTGKPFTEDNIGEILATRDLLSDLREIREIKGGPAPFQPADRSRFLQSLHELIEKTRRKRT